MRMGAWAYVAEVLVNDRRKAADIFLSPNLRVGFVTDRKQRRIKLKRPISLFITLCHLLAPIGQGRTATNSRAASEIA